MAGMMRLIWKTKEKIKYNRRGKSNHDRHLLHQIVKNGFPIQLNSKKVKIKQRRMSKEIVRIKLLSRGCHERTKAQRRVPSLEKVNTDKNLARVMAKSRAGHR